MKLFVIIKFSFLLIASNLASGMVWSNQTESFFSIHRNGLPVQIGLQAGINFVAERNLFWNYAETIAPQANFDENANWFEAYIKPNFSFNSPMENDRAIYSKGSFVYSYTAGVDAYDTGNTGKITLEELHLGYQSKFSDNTEVDFSLGPRELKLGTGMLIANGGTSGFRRGAIKLGPRKAWEMAAIAQVKTDHFNGKFFYLDPNELRSNNSRTTLAGFDARFDHSKGGNVGLTYANVIESQAPYPQAALGGIGEPIILPEAREGLNVVNLYNRTNPIKYTFGEWLLASDIAYEWNNEIDLNAWAGRFQASYTFTKHPWQPSLTYSYQTFSGDDPDTSRLERFDPLYYEGSPSSWSTGSKSSMVFINSNVNSHQLALRITPTAKDTLTLRYAHIRANELLSPIQFGQATRVSFSNGISTVISGVTDHHLSDDLFLEYSHILNPNIYLTLGLSISIPGPGTDSIVNLNTPNWTGGFFNVVVNY